MMFGNDFWEDQDNYTKNFLSYKVFLYVGIGCPADIYLTVPCVHLLSIKGMWYGITTVSKSDSGFSDPGGQGIALCGMATWRK